MNDSDLRRHFQSCVQESLSDDYRTLTRNISAATLLRPMAQLNAASVIEERTSTLEALRDAGYPTASNPLQQFDSSPLCGNGKPNLLNNECGTLFCWYFDTSASSVEQQFNIIARRRLLAIDLAIQLYRADHNRWPAALSELLPRYLPTIPDDPFGAPGKPPEYVIITQDNTPRPLLGCRYTSGLLMAVPTPYHYSAYFYSFSDLDCRWIDLSSPPYEPSNPAASHPSVNP